MELGRGSWALTCYENICLYLLWVLGDAPQRSEPFMGCWWWRAHGWHGDSMGTKQDAAPGAQVLPEGSAEHLLFPWQSLL